ncbi:MAG: flagellar hook protein FlgE [Ignavibacteria bacterium]|jgi:flagellar hook protein FlgE|nr:flagellar hook protein FlgE [Ignavibacteria bacterium]
MGLIRSLSVGTSSLINHQKKFDVISNNLANASTTGYKSTRANFADQFNQIYSRGKTSESAQRYSNGGADPLQFGLGVKLASISQDFSQGVIESTNRPLDVALQGDGFFIVNYDGSQRFTRSGAFTRDNDGYIVDTNTGAFIQGYNVSTDSNGRTERTSSGENMLDRTMANLRIPANTVSLPRQTQEITMMGNLNSDSNIGYDSTRKTSMTIYDETGAARTMTFTFQKVGENDWLIGAEVDGVNQGAGAEGNIALDPVDTTLVQPAYGRVTFNSDGTIATLIPANTDAAKPFTLQFPAAGFINADGNVDKFPKNLNVTLADPNNVSQGLKQLSGDSNANFETQDGFSLGELEDMSVDSRGRILGAFTNGQTEVIGQLAMAKFANNEGLVRDGNNYFRSAPNSGDAVIGTALEIFPTTTMVGNSLEQSNVDLTREMTEMISTQRAFEAASRTVTVSDSLLQEINQLKR